MLAKASIMALLATALFALTAAPTRAQDSKTPEAIARQAMVGHQAPSLKVGHWVNTDGKDLSLAGLRGKVVVLDFFTYW